VKGGKIKRPDWNSRLFCSKLVSNCLSQILERIILQKNPGLEKVSQNQFGFQKSLSTINPLFILKESSIWCKSNKMPCYIVSLDATKVFDSVWRDVLFFKLKNKLPRGVKQAGILSPSFFNLFIDDLLTEIVSQDIGLRINGSNFSVMAMLLR
jgi:hypothetical protein